MSEERREIFIDEDYTASQRYKGGPWTIAYGQPGREQWDAAYYTPRSGVISWTERMPFQDREFIEAWVKQNLTD